MDNKSTDYSFSESPINELSYEQALIQLEEIVKALESEEHSLDKALALFERGQALTKHCTNLLDEAELKVKSLSGDEIADFDMDM